MDNSSSDYLRKLVSKEINIYSNESYLDQSSIEEAYNFILKTCKVWMSRVATKKTAKSTRDHAKMFQFSLFFMSFFTKLHLLTKLLLQCDKY